MLRGKGWALICNRDNEKSKVLHFEEIGEVFFRRGGYGAISKQPAHPEDLYRKRTVVVSFSDRLLNPICLIG